MTTRREFLRHSATVTAACLFAESLARGADAPAHVGDASDAKAQATISAILTRKIPSSGEVLPAVGFGTFAAMMTKDMSDATIAAKANVLKTFYDAGGRLVDTAPSYDNAEEVIGITSSKLGLNDKIFITTKVLERDGGAEAGIKSFERSFQRLQRDKTTKKIEVMQCHNFINWDTHLPTMRKWKDDGQFRYIGVTHYQNHAHEDLQRIIKRDKVDFLQVNYSAPEPQAADRLLPAAKDLGMAVLINRPFVGGEEIRKVQAKPLPDFAKPFASSWAQAMLKFVLAHDAVTCVIPATGNAEHMKDNMQAGVGRLPDAKECEQIRKAFA
jgi:diketogulonate reductase-like aldo/keto reductase